MRRCFLFVVLLLAIPVLAQTKSEVAALGRVSGSVVNASGEPIPEALICFGHYSTSGSSSSCGTSADNQGHFNFQVPLDTNRVWAQKPADGYWADQPMNKIGQPIELTPEKLSAHVSIRLGSAPGHISFRVVDKNTGAPIRNFRITVAGLDEDSVNSRYSARDQSSIAIPSGRDVLILVHATGYKYWFYMDGSSAGQPTVRVQSGEERNVEVDLEPEARAN